MKKSLPVHGFPERKNSFSTLIREIRTSDQILKQLPKKPEIKSVYIRKTVKNLNKGHKVWEDIQKSSEGKYLEKIRLIEQIRQEKIENRIIDLLYPSHGTSVSSESK